MYSCHIRTAAVNRAAGLLLAMIVCVAIRAPSLEAQSSSGASLQDLGQAYRQGFEALHAERFDEALSHFERALELAEGRYGVDDPRTAVELNNLGEVFRLAGDNRRAAAFLERALRIEREQGSAVSAATTMNNLALVYRSLGQLDKAETLYKEGLDRLQDGLGPNHPDVAKSLNNLAMLYVAQGHSDRAGPLLDRALRISTDAVGTDHPTTKLLARNRDHLADYVAVEAANSAGLHAQETHGPLRRRPIARPQRRPEPSFDGEHVDTVRERWALHLASLRDPAAIPETWVRLQNDFPSIRGFELLESEPIDMPDVGIFHRVMVGGLSSEKDGQAICERLETIGQFCRVLRK